jgi:hypothetical protein
MGAVEEKHPIVHKRKRQQARSCDESVFILKWYSRTSALAKLKVAKSVKAVEPLLRERLEKIL